MEEQLDQITKLTKEVNQILAMNQSSIDWSLKIPPQCGHFIALTFKGHFISSFFLFDEVDDNKLVDADQLLFEVLQLISACINFKKAS